MHPLTIKHFDNHQDYLQILKAMQAFTEQRTPETSDECWLLQHSPVFTLGQAGDPQHILNRAGIPVLHSDRGGQVTYHGPGQLVAYCLLDLNRLKLHSRSLVTALETTLIQLLKDFDLIAYADAQAPGIYIQGKKIASLGFRIRKGYAYHGIALNVDMDLTPFQNIHPCGYTHLEMCQLKDWYPQVNFSEVEEKFVKHFTAVLGYTTFTLENGMKGSNVVLNHPVRLKPDTPPQEGNFKSHCAANSPPAEGWPEGPGWF